MEQANQKVIGERALSIETGKLALQANGAVTVTYGETVVLVTACVSPSPREGIDFLPLTIDYEERLYAAGKIPGSFFRREGRPSQEATLASRLTDRPLRPLIHKGFRNDIQIVITVLSADQENVPDILAIIGASAALSISGMPFDGPVSACRVGYVDGQFVVNPTYTQLLKSSVDLVVAGTKNEVIMVEAGCKEVPESLILEAVALGQGINREIVELQEEFISALGIPHPPLPPEEDSKSEDLKATILSTLNGRLSDTLYAGEKIDREEGLSALKKELVGKLSSNFAPEAILATFEEMLKVEVRRKILEEGVRPDGRECSAIRPLHCEVGVLPRTHGSGLFTRGLTQVITIATLGSVRQEQKIDSIGQEESKRFIHHYNFPAFSVGEVRRIGSPGRREIGHGALAERALLPVIPSEEAFPYTIRLVSEVLSSNGSTSMASVCGSSLSLMDAGVPIKTPVAGVAMGLIMGEGNRHAILTDIEGMEDSLGDMDFKVAGTADGVTALQMDTKTKGISQEIMGKALAQAQEARLTILNKMRETISSARPELSPYAPRMTKIVINKEKIGAVIGPGGKTIRSIIEETGVSIDVDNDGTILIGSSNEEATKKAIGIIETLTKEVEVGGTYTGKVVRIMDFGAFVEIVPGKDGLVHISELAEYRVERVEDVVKVGDEIKVIVTEIDRMGRINLSHRAILQGQTQGTGARAKDSLASQRREERPRPYRGNRESRGAPSGGQYPRRQQRPFQRGR